jgi:DNA repair protein RecN (Recombination protein N)
MLHELRVGHLALVEDLNLSLEPGLTMLTGETGAGKSLIAGALSLLTGVKVDRGIIREGEDLAWVEGVFDLGGRTETVAWLNTLGVRLGGDGILVLRRELRREGRGRVLINGLVSSLALLEQIGGALLAIQSQDQQRLLSRPSFAQEFLDNVLELGPELVELRSARELSQQLETELNRRRQEEDFARQQLEMWQYQHRELTGMGLDLAEEPQLAEQLSFARNARSLLEGAGKALAHLTEGQANARQLLGAAEGALAPVAANSQKIAAILGEIEDAEALVSEAAKDLERFLDGAEVDPARLDEMEERKAQYEDLRRKYDRDVAGLIELQEILGERISRQREAAADIEELTTAAANARQKVGAVAADLRAKRIAGAPRVAARACEVIRPLALPEISLEFAVEPRFVPENGIEVDGRSCRVTGTGADDIRLRARTNRGEKGGEVGQIASGGEKSRIYLGLSVLAGHQGEQPLLLFDEIDAGLGMDNAIPVAGLLAELAAGGQVLCITHLATVAARGTAHLKAAKAVVDERTVLTVGPLTGDERLAEIARLLGGEGAEGATAETGSGSRVAYAKQLLARA